jgi:Glycosyl hydrolase family 115
MLAEKIVYRLGGVSSSVVVFAVLFLVACSVALAQKSKSAFPVVIDSSVTIVESQQEPGPVQRATADLLGDFSKVFGQAPKLVHQLQDAGSTVILITGNANVPPAVKCSVATDSETFAFSIVGGRDKRKRTVVCLTGADMRGTIYAIYEFSQQYLGVDPMYLWTDKQPEKRSSVTLPPNFARSFPKPVFKYRVLFPNDEDLLTGWAPAAKGEHTGISLKVWDNIYETTLRLKGNAVSPGTWIFPDDAQVHAAAERGLIISEHQSNSLGVNSARWPKDVPYNMSTHPEVLERAWTNSVAEYKPDEEILWNVGLHPVVDSSYPTSNSSARKSDQQAGKEVSDALVDEMRIVKAKFPKAQFVTTLWRDAAGPLREGYLKIPLDVTLVWSDTGYGDMQDGGKVAAGQGAYFHVAMMDGHANQLTEMVPVKTIQSELGRYIKAGATSYLMLNMSDIRPVAMTTRAVMELAWSGLPAETSDADGAYYRRWATEEFGAKSADALEAVYKEYFAAPSLQPTSAGLPRLTAGGSIAASYSTFTTIPREEGDQHYHSEVKRLLLDKLSGNQVVVVPGQSPKWSIPHLLPSFNTDTESALLGQDIKECEEAQPRWDSVWNHAIAAESLVDSDRRDYYQAEVLTMITVNRESNRMLLLVAKALQDDDAGQTVKAQNEINEALQALGSIQKSMDAAEYGKWKNWYRGDWFTGVDRTRELVQAYANYLRDPLAKVPAPVWWSSWEGYFHIMGYEGNRSVDVR